MMDGRVEARQITRLKEIGAWLKKYGGAIYGTKGGPFALDSLVAFTRKGNKIFALIFGNGGGKLRLPALPGAKIANAYFMNGAAVKLQLVDNMGYEIKLPDIMPDENCSVLVLELDKDAEAIPIMAREAGK